MTPTDFIALVGLIPDISIHQTHNTCLYETRREDIADRIISIAVAADLRVTHVIHRGHSITIEGFE